MSRTGRRTRPEGDAEEREIEEDDLTTALTTRDGLLDIGDLLREQFQLALPMKPLCSAACRGLCVAVRHESESYGVRVRGRRGKIPGSPRSRVC